MKKNVIVFPAEYLYGFKYSHPIVCVGDSCNEADFNCTMAYFIIRVGRVTSKPMVQVRVFLLLIQLKTLFLWFNYNYFSRASAINYDFYCIFMLQTKVQLVYSLVARENLRAIKYRVIEKG